MSLDINDQDLYQGVVLLKVIKECSPFLKKDQSIILENGTSKSSFLLKFKENSEPLGIYIKHTARNRTPWSFSFNREHQEEVEVLEQCTRGVVLMLVCGRDGIVSLDYDELKIILDENFEDSERVSVTRKLRGNYRVTGRDGKLKKTITRSELGKKIVLKFGL